MIVTADIKLWMLFFAELEFNTYFKNSNLYVSATLYFDKHRGQNKALIKPSPLSDTI